MMKIGSNISADIILNVWYRVGDVAQNKGTKKTNALIAVADMRHLTPECRPGEPGMLQAGQGPSVKHRISTYKRNYRE